MRPKITIAGAGHVGSTVAQRLAERDDADIVLVDVVEGLPQGRALDLLQAGPVCGHDSRITGSNGYEETDGSAVAIITSGSPRRPGMSRDELVAVNATIVRTVAAEIASRSPDCVLVVVTNPLDAMAQVAQAASGLPRERVIGMAGVLDTARFRTFLARELDVSVRDVEAHVLGGHGDSMVPLTRLATIAGVPANELIPAPRLEAIVQRVRDGGAEIVDLLRTGSAFYAPSAAVVQMIDAILLDRRRVLPCSVRLQGEYGIEGVFTGVPCRLGAGGLLEVVEMALTSEEAAALRASAASVQDVIDIISARLPDLAGLTAAPPEAR